LASTCDRRAAPRQAGDEARTDGIGDAREYGADAAESRLSCEQNSYFLLLRAAALKTW
jgi:hypothetical protein